jgi:endonuclease/exonuclease/phosphatase family metal-dependent hydrolase
MTNFSQNEDPYWISANGVCNNKPPDSTITVASFNIKFSLKIQEAIKELRSYPFAEADIILLQEMDEKGTIDLSEELQYNYIYFPMSYNRKYKKNFGNAILSKWPIKNPSKKILPHFQPLNKQRRGVTSAIIEYGEMDIRAYSIHLETPILSRSKRIEQLKTAIENISLSDRKELVIAGGDFNSLFAKDVQEMVNMCRSYKLDWSTEDLGYTLQKFSVIKPTLDHIFTKGFRIIDTGKIHPSSASDHSPIWASLKII